MGIEEEKIVSALEKKVQEMIKKNALEKQLLAATMQASKKLDAEIKITKKELSGEDD